MVDNRQSPRGSWSRRALTVVMVSGALAAAGTVAAGGALAATTPPTFGPQVAVGSGFSQPTGVAVDAANNVYVADPGANAVWKVPADGSPITTVGSGFRLPMAVAVDATGNLYVADYNNSRVERIAPDGTQSTAVSQLSAPSGLAVDAAGNVYIADTGGHDILELNVSSNSVSTIASGITLPTGVAVDGSGAVYGVDASSSGNSVTKYVNGQPPEVLPIPGLQNPNAAAFDTQGDLFVANSGLDNVLMVTPGGATSTVGGGYDVPLGVAVNPFGDVIVADTYTPRVTLNPSVDPQTITLTKKLQTRVPPGTSAALAATGGGSGEPVVLSVDPSTYPSDACTISPSGTRVVYAKVGTCVIDLDQAGTLRYLPAHKTVSMTIRPNGQWTLRIQKPAARAAVGTDYVLGARAFDAHGNNLGDVTAITTFTVDNGTCSRNVCSWTTAGASTIRATALAARGKLAVTVGLGITLVSDNAPVTSFAATVGTPVDAEISPSGGSSGSYTYVITAGSLPPGVTLGPDGVFTGTPTQAGSFPFAVSARDSSDSTERASVATSFAVAASS